MLNMTEDTAAIRGVGSLCAFDPLAGHASINPTPILTCRIVQWLHLPSSLSTIPLSRVPPASPPCSPAPPLLTCPPAASQP